MKKALITFAKAPVPGTVKTRLQADIGAEKAVSTYKAFVTEVISQCAKLKNVDRFLGCAPNVSHPFLKELADTYGMQRFKQHGDSLGARIFNAFRHASKKGYSKIVLIGTDSPSLPISFIRKAFSELEKKDFVIGPCFDKGLYLIGMRKEKISLISRNIKIDTGKDVNGIMEKVSKIQISLSLLPFWYDIDTVGDLDFLKQHLTYLNKKLHI
jgi:rSAM/selenodomain-associated transferase 1